MRVEFLKTRNGLPHIYISISVRTVEVYLSPPSDARLIIAFILSLNKSQRWAKYVLF